MDPFVITQTPKGSPILAYGASRGPGWNGKLLAVIAGSFMLLMFTTILIWLFLTSITLPSQRILVVALQPHATYEQLDPTLRRDLPSPWRAALDTRSRFPALLGVSLDQEKKFHAFALVARTSIIADEPGLNISANGVTLLLTDGTEITQESLPTRQALSPIRRLHGNDLAFTLRGDLIAQLASRDLVPELAQEEIHGVWDGLSGQFEFASEQITSEQFPAPMFAVLGTNPPQAVTSGLLNQGIDVRALSQPPHTIGLDPAQGGSLYLYWEERLSATDAGLLTAFRGLGERKPLTLPDGSEGFELLPGPSPVAPNGSTSVFFSERLASSTFLTASTNDQHWPEICRGLPRLVLEGDILGNILASWLVPASWRERIQGFRMLEAGNSIISCVDFS